jgi:hypothetical protein
MSRLAAVCLVVGLAAVVPGVAWLAGPTLGVSGEPHAPQPTDFPLPDVIPGRAVGTAGCAAAACHGGPASASLVSGSDSRRWACAATFVLARDPHTRAYAALESPLAADIMSRMKRPGPATEDVRCLACHTNPSLAASTDSHAVALRSEGVSCEACHGNASGWLHEHTTWTAATRAAGYDRTGMTRLFDLGERALACAGCHVGAPADERSGYPVRDMNHDMIAAGHPPLNFDFADYQHTLPPHWHEADRSPDFDVKAWLVGRVAHAEAACRLLADRAKRAAANDPRSPWPEFAEWSCVSCHHNLGKGFSSPGSPSWQSIWPVTQPADFATLNAFGPVGMADVLKVIETPRPRIAGTDAAARATADALAKVRAALVAAPDDDVRAAVHHVLKSPENRIESLDRDVAGQLFHGLAAAERTRLGRAGHHDPDPAFDRLYRELRLSRGTLRFDLPAAARTDLKELLSKVK